MATARMVSSFMSLIPGYGVMVAGRQAEQQLKASVANHDASKRAQAAETLKHSKEEQVSDSYTSLSRSQPDSQEAREGSKMNWIEQLYCSGAMLVLYDMLYHTRFILSLWYVSLKISCAIYLYITPQSVMSHQLKTIRYNLFYITPPFITLPGLSNNILGCYVDV